MKTFNHLNGETGKNPTNLFDHLKNICVGKKPLNENDPEQMKTYVPYMINRFVSMCEIYLPLVNEVNKYSTISKQSHQRFFRKFLPQRNQFFKYIKKVKDLNREEKQYIMDYFECSLREANMYIDLLSKEQLKELLNKYKFGSGLKRKI